MEFVGTPLAALLAWLPRVAGARWAARYHRQRASMALGNWTRPDMYLRRVAWQGAPGALWAVSEVHGVWT